VVANAAACATQPFEVGAVSWLNAEFRIWSRHSPSCPQHGIALNTTSRSLRAPIPGKPRVSLGTKKQPGFTVALTQNQAHVREWAVTVVTKVSRG
jgi:hypothetical protein